MSSLGSATERASLGTVMERPRGVDASVLAPSRSSISRRDAIGARLWPVPPLRGSPVRASACW
eukprot:5193349-Prymnesium_polylepis.1